MSLYDPGAGWSIDTSGISVGDWSLNWGGEEVETFEDPDDDRIVELVPENDNSWMFSPWLLLGFGGIAYLLLRKK